MFIKIRYCSISLCILLLNLNVLCQGRRKTPMAYQESEEVVSTQENAQKKTRVHLANKCRPDEILYPGDQFDDWVCDCKPGYIYYPAMTKCYPAYKRGPCRSGQYLILPMNQIIPKCLPNPCRRDNFVPFRSGCYEFGTSGPCEYPELSNVVGVNETTLEIICTKDYLSLEETKDLSDYLH